MERRLSDLISDGHGSLRLPDVIGDIVAQRDCARGLRKGIVAALVTAADHMDEAILPETGVQYA
jgi:hypothetical protein